MQPLENILLVREFSSIWTSATVPYVQRTSVQVEQEEKGTLLRTIVKWPPDEDRIIRTTPTVVAYVKRSYVSLDLTSVAVERLQSRRYLSFGQSARIRSNSIVNESSNGMIKNNNSSGSLCSNYCTVVSYKVLIQSGSIPGRDFTTYCLNQNAFLMTATY